MFDVLAALRRCGAPYELSPGQLVAQTLVTSGTMTNRLDRLEALGYLTRSPDPADGRGVRVRLTGAGAERADAAIGSLLEREEAILGSLTVRQRSQLGTLLRHVVAPFDA